MADRRVVVEITVKVTMDVEEGISLDNIITSLYPDIKFEGEEATVYDSEIINWNLIDSK